jgi:hypothetical protein
MQALGVPELGELKQLPEGVAPLLFVPAVRGGVPAVSGGVELQLVSLAASEHTAGDPAQQTFHDQKIYRLEQCCGSGSGIRHLFDH